MGFVDFLVYIIGGGGEVGFVSRIFEMNLIDVILYGIIMVVVVFGIDLSSWIYSNLIVKVKVFKEWGLNVFCYIGLYYLFVKILIGLIINDIMYIEEFIGVGEVVIFDYCSS